MLVALPTQEYDELSPIRDRDTLRKHGFTGMYAEEEYESDSDVAESGEDDVAESGEDESQSSKGVAMATMAAKDGSGARATMAAKTATVGSTTEAAAPRNDRAKRIITSDTDDGDDSDSNDFQSDVMSDHQEEDIGGSNEIAVAAQSNRTKKRKSESETSTTAQSEKALKSKKKNKNLFEKLSSGKSESEKPAYGSRSKVQLPPHNPSDHSDYYGKGRKV